MKEITVKRLKKAELDAKGVFDWPIWEKEVSRFPWRYDADEACYILDGEAAITPGDARAAVTVRAGDYVVFPVGLSCVWDITVAIRKHYNFY